MTMWQKIWQNKFVISIILLLSLGLRLYSATAPAHPYDIGTYQAWGNIMLEKGPKLFFQSTWSDYLPLPIYFVSFIAYLSNTFTLNFSLIFKLIVTLIEAALVFFIYHHVSIKNKHFLLPLLLLSPALIGDSAYWGQLDTIPALLALLSLVLILNPKCYNLKAKVLPGLLFGLALAFKPIMIIIAPVLLVLGFQKKSLWSNTLAAALVFLLPAYPAAPGLSLFTFLKEKTIEQASTYPFRTINAFNFWNIHNPLNLWAPDSASIFGITAHNFGLFLFASLSLFTLNYWRQYKFSPKLAPFVASLLLMLFYTFTTRMHERHLIFGLPFLALSVLESPMLIFPYIISTFFFLLNLWGAYYWVIHDQRWPFSYLTTQVISWGVTLTTLFLTFFHLINLQALKSWLLKNKLIVVILLLASLLRFVNLGTPNQYIFDEVYHAFTAREFMHNHIEAWEWWTTPPEGVAYEWTHPPLAKYGMALGMWIFGENAFGWRFFSAVMGVISIYGLYTFIELLTKNKNTALLAAFLVSIEGLHLSQSRIAMNDMYMLAFLIWSLVTALKGNFKVAAVLYGLSLSSKWSALYGVVPLAVIYLNQHKFTFRIVFDALRYLLISIAIYLLVFTPFILAGHTIEQFVELHRQMWYYHTHLVATHAYQSTPWEWVLSLRPVWYYVDYGVKTANIYAQGNPMILWLGLVAVSMLIQKIFNYQYFLLFLLYGIFTLPWIISPRIMFFYHYLPSAFFLCSLLAVWLSTLSKKYTFFILVLCSLVFLIMSPVYFGIHMPQAYWDSLYAVFPSWK